MSNASCYIQILHLKKNIYNKNIYLNSISESWDAESVIVLSVSEDGIWNLTLFLEID